MSGKVTDKHRRLAFQHAKKHVLEDLKTMFSDLMRDEHHSICRASDGVDLGDEVQTFLERYEKKLRRTVYRDSWWTAKMTLPRRKRR